MMMQHCSITPDVQDREKLHTVDCRLTASIVLQVRQNVSFALSRFTHVKASTTKLFSCRTAGCSRADLKDHAHGGGHLDDFTVGQAQLLVVVQHSVHVLNPQGIHRPV